MSIVTKREVVKKKRKISFKLDESVCDELQKLEDRVNDRKDLDLHLDEAIEDSIRKLIVKANKELERFSAKNREQPNPITSEGEGSSM